MANYIDKLRDKLNNYIFPITLTKAVYKENTSTTLDDLLIDKLDTSAYTASDALAKIKTVDGAGSGLDADLLDGKEASAFSLVGHNHTASNITDFDTEVSNNTDVTANTSARHTHSNKAVLAATTASYTTAEKTKLSGISTGAEVNVNSDWSATSGDAQILNKPTTIFGYGITDAYTKAEIDNKVSAVYRYKGDVASYSNLPSSGQVTGDVYNVTDTGVNYAWNGTTWDGIGGTEALATASNNGLITKEDFTKLSGIATGATKNDTDANLKNRANHTGTQPASTISDFTTAVLTAAPAETVSSIGAVVNGATAKNSPVDADILPLMDSADSNKIKKFSWSYVKSVLNTYFSSIFAPLTHKHTISEITDITATATELNYTDGVTSNIQTQLNSKLPSSSYIASDVLTKLKTVDGSSSGLDADLLDGKEASAFSLGGHTHVLSGITDVTATVAELNVLDGITASTTELNYVDGVTSNIQVQLNDKANTSSLATVATSGSYSDLSNKPEIPTISNTLISRANDNSAPAGSAQIDANLLDGYDSGYFANIQLSSTQPTGQRTNDFWLRIV